MSNGSYLLKTTLTNTITQKHLPGCYVSPPRTIMFSQLDYNCPLASLACCLTANYLHLLCHTTENEVYPNPLKSPWMPYASTKPTPSLPNIFTMSFNILFQSIYLFFYLFPLESKTAYKGFRVSTRNMCICIHDQLGSVHKKYNIGSAYVYFKE